MSFVRPSCNHPSIHLSIHLSTPWPRRSHDDLTPMRLFWLALLLLLLLLLLPPPLLLLLLLLLLPSRPQPG